MRIDLSLSSQIKRTNYAKLTNTSGFEAVGRDFKALHKLKNTQNLRLS